MYGIKILKEHERLVLFSEGVAQKVLGPGVVFVHPIFQASRKIDISQKKLDFQVNELGVNSKGSCTVTYSYRITDPFSAAVKVLNPDEATMLHIEKEVKKQFRDKDNKSVEGNTSAIARSMTGEVNRSAGTWGAKIYSIEIKDLRIPL